MDRLTILFLAILSITVAQLTLGSTYSGSFRCDPSFFQLVLPDGVELQTASNVTNGSSFGQPPGFDIAYPNNATNLPELCATIFNVTSFNSTRSTFTFGLFLPREWNGRFLTVGNGGMGGGINWPDMGAVCLEPLSTPA